MWRSRRPFVAAYTYPHAEFEQCRVRDATLDVELLAVLVALASVVAFVAGYTARAVSSIKGTTASASSLQRLYSHVVQTVRDEYSAFEAACDVLYGDGKYESSEEVDDASTDSASESDVETPKALKEEATDYFPPTMSRRRAPDTPIPNFEPNSPLLRYLRLDQTLMNWATSLVEETVAPTAMNIARETAPKGAAPGSTKLLQDMYQAFRQEVSQVIVS